MIKEYQIAILHQGVNYDGKLYPLTFRGDSEGECNAKAIKWCLENMGDPMVDWMIVNDLILEDNSLEHFWGLDKVN